MLEVEVFGGARRSPGRRRVEVERLCALALARPGCATGTSAVEFVDAARIRELNSEHRGSDGPTDVLSFPIDGADPRAGRRPPRELGDIVICPEHTDDLREAVVHGALHLSRDGPRERRRRDARAAGASCCAGGMRDPQRASSRSPGGRTSASRRSSTRSSASKVAIVSDRPQTTRRAIRGVATDGDWQIVLVDLPGVQRPRDALTERMARRVQPGARRGRRGAAGAQRRAGGGARRPLHRAGAAQALARPVTIAVNKVDRLDRAATVAALRARGRARRRAPRSSRSRARTGRGVGALVDHLARADARRGRSCSPRVSISDQPLDVLLAELDPRGGHPAHLPGAASRRRGRSSRTSSARARIWCGCAP